MNDSTAALITDADRVHAIAAAVRDAGLFAFDLEFVSEGRYIPELALLQVGWRAAGEISVAAVDCLAVDPAPLLELVAADDVATVAHAAKQDLGLLASRHGLRARNLWDSQIAAAFVGVGDQVGYGRLIEHLLDRRLDKGAQFTNWLARPLSERQLRYALDDVRFLLPAWDRLRAELERRGRLQWVREESDALAEDAAHVGDPDEAYLEVKGASRLEPRQLGALRALAGWREREARTSNKPPSWILPDRAMIDACRVGARSERDLKAIRGIGEGTLRRYGAQILEQLQAGASSKLPRRLEVTDGLEPPAQLRAAVVVALVQARCTAEQVAARFVGTRADAEALVAWFERGCPSDVPAPPLLQGWRREMVGDTVLRFLRGECAVVADRASAAGLRVVDVP